MLQKYYLSGAKKKKIITTFGEPNKKWYKVTGNYEQLAWRT